MNNMDKLIFLLENERKSSIAKKLSLVCKKNTTTFNTTMNFKRLNLKKTFGSLAKNLKADLSATLDLVMFVQS